MCKKKIVPHFSVVSSFIPASPSTPSPPLHRCWASISFIIVSSCRVVELPQWLEGMVHLRLFKRASYYSSCITNCSTANQPTAYIAKRHYFHLGCYKSDRNFSSMVFSIFSFVQNQQLSLCLPSPPLITLHFSIRHSMLVANPISTALARCSPSVVSLSPPYLIGGRVGHKQPSGLNERYGASKQLIA
jgi:hypothetical protein